MGFIFFSLPPAYYFAFRYKTLNPEKKESLKMMNIPVFTLCWWKYQTFMGAFETTGMVLIFLSVRSLPRLSRKHGSFLTSHIFPWPYGAQGSSCLSSVTKTRGETAWDPDHYVISAFSSLGWAALGCHLHSFLVLILTLLFSVDQLSGHTAK